MAKTAKGRLRQTEAADQMAVVRWARQNQEMYPCLRWLYHPANEGKVDPREAGKRQSLGVVAGISDLVLPFPTGAYHGLFIEMKKKPNKPTADQADFLQYAADNGYMAVVCYSREDAITTLENYLAG